MINSWVGSHENEPEYNGNMCGERNTRSIEVVPLYDRWGNANVKYFSDEAIAARKGKTKPTGIPITDRILPQKRRLNTLYEQMQELENSYRSGEMSISDYTLYRDIIVAKIQRQEVLYKRAASVRPIREESEEDEGVSYTENLSTPSDNNGHGESYSSPVGVGFFAKVIDELSDQNSFKNILKKACKVTRTVRYCSHKVINYWQELKEV